MKALSDIYAFIILVIGGAFFGFLLGVIIASLNSIVLFYAFKADLGVVLGVLHFLLPTVGGAFYGYKAWEKRVGED